MKLIFEKYGSKKEDTNRLVSKVNSLASNIVICSYALSNRFTVIYKDADKLEVSDINISYNKGNFLKLSMAKNDNSTDSGTLNKLMRINKIISDVDELKDYDYSDVDYEAISSGQRIITIQKTLTIKKKA